MSLNPATDPRQPEHEAQIVTTDIHNKAHKVINLNKPEDKPPQHRQVHILHRDHQQHLHLHGEV